VDELRVFAPGTVANLGPGFDVLGLALEQPGDTVVVRRSVASGVTIASIAGDGGVLPREADKNTAGIAAMEVLRRADSQLGVELDVVKGMPLGSGLGSSAASAAAAAVGVNRLLGDPLTPLDLVACCVEAEAVVSGRHADNVAPAVLGGLVLVRTLDPLDVHRLPIPPNLYVVVVTPVFELPTRVAREALPDRVPLGTLVQNSANLSALIHALHSNDIELLGRALVDKIVTPARIPLIPGCDRVIEAARDAGALASSISGSGPSVFALCASNERTDAVAAAMSEAFSGAGLKSSAVVSAADCPGAQVL
jgi:homoserine kinase